MADTISSVERDGEVLHVTWSSGRVTRYYAAREDMIISYPTNGKTKIGLAYLDGSDLKLVDPDGTVYTVAGGGGSGDMTKAVYDPQTIEGDAFDTDNHTDGSTNGVYTLVERAKLAAIEAGATADLTGAEIVTLLEALGIGSRLSHTKLDDVGVSDHHAKYTDAEAVVAAKTVKLDDLTAPDDNTDLDGSAAKHGLYPKADASKLAGIAAGADVTADNDPKAHATSHKTTGSDEIDLDELGTPSDNTNLDATDALHGLMSKADKGKLDGVAAGADVTGDNAPQAHKDSHDPEDGGDPLDCAAPSELAGVQAAAEGSAHTFARSDHTHQIQHAITDNHIVTVDGSPANGEYPVWTANGLDGKSLAEFLTLILASSIPENVAILLDSALSADGKYSGICFAGTAGTNLAFGEVVYFASADSKWEKTDADAEATTKPRVAIVVVAGNEDASIRLMELGYIREDDWNWTTPGAPLFIDITTAGGLTETAPTGNGDCIRVAGYVIDSNTIFFNPSKDWFEHA